MSASVAQRESGLTTYILEEDMKDEEFMDGIEFERCPSNVVKPTLDDAWKPCPFCGHLPEIITCERGAYTGLSRAFHKCEVIGYIEIQDWSENIQRGKERWNSRVVV